MGNDIYQIALGQDCTTVTLLGYSEFKTLPFFFDSIALYSRSYKELFQKEFFDSILGNVHVYIKDPIEKLNELYVKIKNKEGKVRDYRVNFHATCGDKYTNIYVDCVHVDGQALVDKLDMTSFQTFMYSIDDGVKSLAFDHIKTNIRNSRRVYEQHKNDNIVFFRTIKHVMSKNEIDDLQTIKVLIRQMFPNSQLVVVTNMKENLIDDSVFYMELKSLYGRNEQDRLSFKNLLSKNNIGKRK